MRPQPAIADNEKSNGQRVVRISSLLMFVTLLKPTSGRNRPKARSVVMPASRKALAVLERPFSNSPAILDLLDVGAAEQALRQEDQRDGQHGERGNVFVVDGEIS